MQQFAEIISEALILEDKVFIEYYASPASSVVLHYIIEKEGQEKMRYTTCRLYPAYGGVFSKAFPLFAGEKITYFITEKREDGSEVTTSSMTKVKEACAFASGTKYERISKMRDFDKKGQKRELLENMQQYRYLEMASEQLFPMK